MENNSKQNDPTYHSTCANDAPLVDQVLQQPEREAQLTVFEEADMSEQLSAMRLETLPALQHVFDGSWST
ncbi:hypothetical protein LJR231_002565 [Phyllobacterium sp. LjRoot231]|uniref:hypothetical protein n=1 Tax=Phyllobacterium sp. LjRoot231 TaxID=3342289 RepID=UPI003ECFA230